MGNTFTANNSPDEGSTAPGQHDPSGFTYDFNPTEYALEVSDSIGNTLKKVDPKNTVWTANQMKVVAKGLGEIASNIRKNINLTGQVIDSAIVNPLNKFNKPGNSESVSAGGVGQNPGY